MKNEEVKIKTNLDKISEIELNKLASIMGIFMASQEREEVNIAN